MGDAQRGGDRMDVRTLVFAVGIACVAETVVLALQWRLDRSHSGPGWWALGIGVLTVSFLSAVELPPGTSASIVAVGGAVLRAAAYALVLVGLVRFVGGRERPVALVALCALAGAVVAVAGLVGEQYRAYVTVNSITAVMGSAGALWVLLGPRTRDFRTSALVTAAGFLLLAAFFLVRIPIVLAGGPMEDPFAQTPSNVLAQIVRLVAILVVTVGLVLMSNERLARDLVASRDRVHQAERAEMVGRLAGGVAHNFNNLLQVIVGHAELLDESLPNDDPRRDDTRAIHAAAGRATALTRQLLAIGHAGPSRPTSVDVDALLADLAPLLDQLSGEGAPVIVHHGASGGTVRADPANLRDTILALVLRASERAGGGDAITVTSATVAVGPDEPGRRATARPGRFVRISVSDPGERVGADRLAHVFEPFYSVDVGGWGPDLGLSTVEAVVVEAGGYMTATSDPGGGTTFAAYLPLEGEGRTA